MPPYLFSGIIVSADAAGGIFAGMGVSAICGPTASICAIAVVLPGTVAGEAVASVLDEELEEFTYWDIF